jgi:hypothetical protein
MSKTRATEHFGSMLTVSHSIDERASRAATAKISRVVALGR